MKTLVTLTHSLVLAAITTALVLSGCSSQVIPPQPTHSAVEIAPTPSLSSPASSPATRLAPAYDTGVRPGARGFETPAGKNAYAYVPATDDNEQGVAERFSICVDDIRFQTDGRDLEAGRAVHIEKTTHTALTSPQCLNPGTIYH